MLCQYHVSLYYPCPDHVFSLLDSTWLIHQKYERVCVKRACSDLEPVFYIKYDYRRTLWNPVLNHNLSFLFFKLYHKTNCMYVICSDPESSFFVKGQGHCRPQHKIHLLNPIVLLLTLSAVCIIHRLFGQGWAIIVHLMIRWRLSSKQNCLNYAFILNDIFTSQGFMIHSVLLEWIVNHWLSMMPKLCPILNRCSLRWAPSQWCLD